MKNIKKLKKIFEKIFKVKISDKKFKNLKINDIEQWDSMSNLNFIFEIEDVYHFKFKAKDLENANSIKFFIKYLEKKV